MSAIKYDAPESRKTIEIAGLFGAETEPNGVLARSLEEALYL